MQHYQQCAIKLEPIAICSLFNFCFGNYLKYVLRAPYKGQRDEDLQKALNYLSWCEMEGDQLTSKLNQFGSVLYHTKHPLIVPFAYCKNLESTCKQVRDQIVRELLN